MRIVVTVIYVVMAAWLLVAAGIRVALLLGAGLPLDPLPFISGAIAILALVALPAAHAELRQRREATHRETTRPADRFPRFDHE